MQPGYWQPEVSPSLQEEQIIKRIRKAKRFIFLRKHRHELFNASLQQQLATLYQPSKRGHPPIAPAQLSLAIILQAYTGVSDDEVIEATLMDRRWQLVLDCLDTEQPPFEPWHIRCVSEAPVLSELRTQQSWPDRENARCSFIGL